MAAHGRTTKTNGKALPIASAMPAQMIVSDRCIGLRDRACAPVTIRCAGCPAGLRVARPSTKHPAEAPARMKSVKMSAAPAERTASIVSETGCQE